MKIQVHTDTKIQGHEKFVAVVEAAITKSLGHFNHVTHVEVHLSQENGVAPSKLCIMEASIEGQQSTTVKCEAANLDEAISGAADNLQRTLKTMLERWENEGGATPTPAPDAVAKDIKPRPVRRWENEGGAMPDPDALA